MAEQLLRVVVVVDLEKGSLTAKKRMKGSLEVSLCLMMAMMISQ